MPRRLDLGVASYGNPEGLARVLQSVVRRSTTDWRCLVVLNPHPDPAQRQAVEAVLQGQTDPRILVFRQVENVGYVGAVNWLLATAETEYIAYLDHDVEIQTDGWDEAMASVLDRFHEIGMVFPEGGAYPIDREVYVEVLWAVGCAWMLPSRVAAEVGLFDASLGHHEEVDYQSRVRLAGLRIAAAKGVHVHHAAKASSSPDQQARISEGVIRWVTKWVRYHGGKSLNYHSPNVLRHEDWPPSALYLEEYWKLKLPSLNAEPEVIEVDGVKFDLIKVPRLSGFYRHRVI